MAYSSHQTQFAHHHHHQGNAHMQNQPQGPHFPDFLSRFPKDPADYDRHAAAIRHYLHHSLGLNDNIVSVIEGGGQAFEAHYKEGISNMLTIYNHEAHTRLAASVDLGNPRGFVVRTDGGNKENGIGTYNATSGQPKNILPPTPTSTPSSRAYNHQQQQSATNRAFASAQSNAGSPNNNRLNRMQHVSSSSPSAMTSASAARAKGFVNALQQQQQHNSTGNNGYHSTNAHQSPTNGGKFTVLNSAMSANYKQQFATLNQTSSSVGNRGPHSPMTMTNTATTSSLNSNGASVYSLLENVIQPSFDLARDSDMSVGQRSTGGGGLLAAYGVNSTSPAHDDNIHRSADATTFKRAEANSVSPVTPEGIPMYGSVAQQQQGGATNRPSVFTTPPVFKGFQYTGTA